MDSKLASSPTTKIVTATRNIASADDDGSGGDVDEALERCAPPPLRYNLERNLPVHIEHLNERESEEDVQARTKRSWELWVATENLNRIYYIKWQRQHPTTRMATGLVFPTGQTTPEDAMYRAKHLHDNDTRYKSVETADPELVARSMRNMRNRIAREGATN